MMKVLIIQDDIRHYRKPVYNELSKCFDVTVLHGGSKSVSDDDMYAEILASVKRIGPFFWQSGVLRAVRKGDYDVVIVMFDIHWVANIMAVFLKKNTRFLYWGHRYSRNLLGNRMRDILMRISDGVVLYGDSEIDRMISRGMPESKVFVAPNTVHVSNHSDGSGARKDSLLFAGRAQERKRVDILIRAFSEIVSRIPDNIEINIVGSGTENDRLKSMARQLGVSSRVVFHGEILDNEKLKPLFQRAFAYVSPGPVGLGVLHSFAYGLPVVTHISERHGPEFDNVADNENSLVYSTYDGLKKILVDLCNDKTLTARLGKNAYQLYADHRSLDRMVQGFREAIENPNLGM